MVFLGSFLYGIITIMKSVLPKQPLKIKGGGGVSRQDNEL
jgi:hypothetical protein